MAKSKSRKKNRGTVATPRKAKENPEEGKKLLKIVLIVTLVMMVLMFLIFQGNNG